MWFRAVAARGRPLGSSRDLAELQQRLANRSRASVARSLAKAAPRPGSQPAAAAPAAALGAAPGSDQRAGIAEQTGLTDWTFGDLPELVDTRVAGGVVRGYPALVDEGTAVTLRIEATPDRAERLTRAGVRRLVLLSVPSPATYVLDHLTAPEKLALAASPYPSAKALIEDARVAVADAVIDRTAASVRTPAQFQAVRGAFSAAVVDELFQTVSLSARILTLQRDVERAIRKENSMVLLAALGDVKQQLAGLVFPGFLSQTGTARLAHLPRYLQGALERVTSLSDNPGRDRQRLTEFERAATLYTEAGGTIPPADDAPPNLRHARWLLEEYRVSLFAQRLGTAEPVSIQRITKMLAGKG
jgi:ATP-dependent helicase HrpA